MSRLEMAMDMLFDVFLSYAISDGDHLNLSAREMKDLCNGELNQIMLTNRNPQKVASIIANLDKNLDGQVDFEEFAAMVVKLTMCGNPYFDKIGGRLTVRVVTEETVIIS